MSEIRVYRAHGVTLKRARKGAERIAEEAASFGRMLSEPAAREAFGAFMEKRRPDFSSL